MNEKLLAEWCAEIVAEPTRIRTRFPAAAREIGRTRGTSPEPGAERVEDDVRVSLLVALGRGLVGDADTLSTEVHDLYRFGDADERRAVLLGLGPLDDAIGDRAVDLLHDALRTNDPRLVAAALGTYAARLDPAAWRQAVLKCLFVGVPLRLVAGLDPADDPADDELRRMVADYAAERRAAGREVPADALPFLPVPTQTTRES
ncbi:MAG: EboA domain-containing protein [Actinomycetota bacterium]|nr:EboA domain-containing protein [Actinomycetota bacterium]